MFVLTFLSTFLILSRGRVRRNNDEYHSNSDWDRLLSMPQEINHSPRYDITFWVKHLHLQQCAIVEIGDRLCALFIELRDIPNTSTVSDNFDVAEFFLGLCTCATLRSWAWCTPMLTNQRPRDCTFAEATPYANTSARVHRRLCDVTLLSTRAPICNCSISIAGQQLYKTEGSRFPTCFLDPLPDSICSPRGVCGVARCTAVTIMGIHSSRCVFNCHQRQPFCEDLGPWTSIPPAINSLWSRWSPSKCNNACGRGLLAATSLCHNQVTGMPAIDCIGPGSFCCPEDFRNCSCEVVTVDDILIATRYTESCVSTEGCASRSIQEIGFKKEFQVSDEHAEYDTTYDEEEENDVDEREFDYLESSRPTHRLLLQVSSGNKDHKILRSVNRRLAESKGSRVAVNARLADNDEDDEDEEEEEEDEEDNENNEGPDNTGIDEDEEAEGEDEEETDNEETVAFRGSAKGRRGPRRHALVARSDYARTMFEGKKEVDEPEKKEAMRIRSVTEECDDESTEVSQYYEYEAEESKAISRGVYSRVLVASLALQNFLLLLG